MGQDFQLRDVDVLILAGGLGTRLRGVLPDTPKILAPILGRPFLEHLLRWLASQGCRRVVLSLGYRADAVKSWLDSASLPLLDIRTVVEPEPMGTGGAIAFAAATLGSDPVLVMNGDTVVEVDLKEFLRFHQDAKIDASILCVGVENPGRYGQIEIDDFDRVQRFAEKDPNATGPNWINAGLYLFSQRLVGEISTTLSRGSLERDILEKRPVGSVGAFRTNGRFLDIGTPETLALAADLLSPEPKLGESS